MDFAIGETISLPQAIIDAEEPQSRLQSQAKTVPDLKALEFLQAAIRLSLFPEKIAQISEKKKP